MGERSEGTGFFIEPDLFVYQCYNEIVDYIQHCDQYKQAHKDKFMEKADAWVIALAKARSLTVATDEGWVNNHSTKVKIPNLCDYFGVPREDMYGMLGALKMKLR